MIDLLRRQSACARNSRLGLWRPSLRPGSVRLTGEDKVKIFGGSVAIPQLLDHWAGLRHGCSFFPTTEPHLVHMRRFPERARECRRVRGPARFLVLKEGRLLLRVNRRIAFNIFLAVAAVVGDGTCCKIDIVTEDFG